ncbi:ABC transporter permease [Ensifer canadensis]
MIAKLRRHPAGNVIIVFLLAQALCIAASVLFPASFFYLTSANMSALLDSIPILGIVALGVAVLMISGEFDLSVGSVLVFTALVMGELYDAGVTPWLGALIAIVVGGLIGLLNGWLVLTLKLPSFIVTLGGMLFWKGMALFISGARQIKFAPEGLFGDLAYSKFWVVPSTFLWFTLLAVVFHIVLQHRRFGNHVFAVGGNAGAANAIGINVRRVKYAAFTLCGMTAAFAGILSSARLGSISPTQGANYELDAIAACVVGGIALTGGRGSIVAVFLGVILINMIRDVLLLVGAPGFYLSVFVGALIVAAAALNQAFRPQN